MDKLVHAVQHGDFPYVENCIEALNFSPDAVDEETCSVLHWAAINNRYDIVKYLISKHANVNIVGGVNAEIPIQWAIRHPRALRLVSYLVECGSNIHHQSVYGHDCLFIAIQEGRVNAAFLLLHKGANPNTVDSNGDTPLLWLVRNEQAIERRKLIRLLISFHANVSAVNQRDGNNALHMLILKEHGFFDIMLADEVYQAARDSLMSQRNKEGLTPSELAYKNKSRLAVSFFNDAFMHSTLPSYTTIVTSAVAVCLVFVIIHFCGLLWGSGLFVPLYFAWYSTSQQCIINAQSRWSCGWAWGVVVTIVTSYFLFLSLQVHYLLTLYFTANVIVICTSLYLTMNTEPANISSSGSSIAAKDELVHRMLLAEDQMALSVSSSSSSSEGAASEVSICPTCLVDKAQASIHCAKCNLCVVHLDHHCPFVCNCVGRGNRLLFVWFTGSASLGCAFFAALSFYLQYTLHCPHVKGMLWSFFAVQQCMLSLPGEATLVYVTFLSAAVSLWIFFLFVGQINMIAMETTTFQLIRYDNKGTENICSPRAINNVINFCLTGEYSVLPPKPRQPGSSSNRCGNKHCNHDHGSSSSSSGGLVV